MSHQVQTHVTPSSDSCHTNFRHMSHQAQTHVTPSSDICHTKLRHMSHQFQTHVTPSSDTCHTKLRHMSHQAQTRHTKLRPMSHQAQTHVTPSSDTCHNQSNSVLNLSIYAYKFFRIRYCLQPISTVWWYHYTIKVQVTGTSNMYECNSVNYIINYLIKSNQICNEPQ